MKIIRFYNQVLNEFTIEGGQSILMTRKNRLALKERKQRLQIANAIEEILAKEEVKVCEEL